MEGGRTVHNRFGLGLNVGELTDCLKGSASIDNVMVELLWRTKIILWDERTMSSLHIVDCVDRALQKNMDNKLPFTGKFVVFGDFRQTLALQTKCSQSQVLYCLAGGRDTPFTCKWTRQGSWKQTQQTKIC